MALSRKNFIKTSGLGALALGTASFKSSTEKEKNLKLGDDVAIVISSDAIHYGDEGWGGKNMAPFGVDIVGTEKARLLDLEIIDKCLTDDISNEKLALFNQYTIQEDNFKEYKWTWCGRYSVPFGLLFANKLNFFRPYLFLKK